MVQTLDFELMCKGGRSSLGSGVATNDRCIGYFEVDPAIVVQKRIEVAVSAAAAMLPYVLMERAI